MLKKLMLLICLAALVLVGCEKADTPYENGSKTDAPVTSGEIKEEKERFEVISLKNGFEIRSIVFESEIPGALSPIKLDDKYYIFTVDNRKKSGEIEFCLVDISLGELVSSCRAESELYPTEVRYTDEGVIIYRSYFDSENKEMVTEVAFELSAAGNKLMCEEIEISPESYFPFCNNIIASPDGNIFIKKMIYDGVSHGGIEICREEEEGELVLSDIMLDDELSGGGKAGIKDVKGYYPIEFISKSEFVYRIGGWEWTWGYGIFNTETGEKREFLDGKAYLSSDSEGNIYIGETADYRFSNVWQIDTEGNEKRIATVMEDGGEANIRLYGRNLDLDYKNGHALIYDYDHGIIGGRENMPNTISVYSPDFSELIAKIALYGEDGYNNVLYKDGVLTVVTFEKIS